MLALSSREKKTEKERDNVEKHWVKTQCIALQKMTSCRPQALGVHSMVKKFCVLSHTFGSMYQTATVPVLLLHLSCSILGGNAGCQQAVTLLYKLCDFTCKRDL